MPFAQVASWKTWSQREPHLSGALVSQVRFAGATPLGTSLDRKVLQPLVVAPAYNQHLRKPVLCLIITDGEQKASLEVMMVPLQMQGLLTC